HTRFKCDWSSDVCSSDLTQAVDIQTLNPGLRHERAQGAADPPLRAFDRIAHVRNRDRNGHDDPIVGCALSLLHCHPPGLALQTTVSFTSILPRVAFE